MEGETRHDGAMSKSIVDVDHLIRKWHITLNRVEYAKQFQDGSLISIYMLILNNLTS